MNSTMLHATAHKHIKHKKLKARNDDDIDYLLKMTQTVLTHDLPTSTGFKRCSPYVNKSGLLILNEHCFM
jgi:hypothetical protein